MKLMDFAPGMESLKDAYRDATDELVRADPGANQRVLDLLNIWGDALGIDYEVLASYDDVVLREQKAIRKHQEAVEQLTLAVRQFNSQSIEIWSEYLRSTLKTYLEWVAKNAFVGINGPHSSDSDVRVHEAHNNYRTINLLISRLEVTDLSYRLRQGLEQARQAVVEAEAAAEAAKKAAGVASGSTLTERFKTLARKHFWAATGFRILTTLGVILGIGGGLNLSVAGIDGSDNASAGDAIIRVSLLAGVLGLATYFGRQAAYHRDVSTWASTIKEQLLTFDGYTEPVANEDLRDQMRAAFAARVFGSSPESKDDAGVTLSSPVLSEVAAMFAKATTASNK